MVLNKLPPIPRFLKKRFHWEALIGLIFGLCIVGAFILLDLQELNMNLTVKNILWVITGQNILKISVFFFPLFSTMLGIALGDLRHKNKHLKVLNDEAQRSRDYIESIFKSLSDMIFIIDQDGHYLKLNDHAMALIAKYDSQCFSDLFHGKHDWAQFREHYLLNPHADLELKLKDGKTSIILSSSNLTFKNSSSAQFICSVKDIQALVDLQEEVKLQTLQNAQNARLASLGEMAAGIAHEINNPLAIIKLAADFLGKKLRKIELGEEQAKLIARCEDIKNTVDRAHKIVGSMRELSRDCSNEPFTPTDFGEIIDRALPLHIDKLKFNNIDLRIDRENLFFSQKIPMRSVQMSQVILNMLSNSIDAISNIESRWIELKGEIKEHEAWLWVMDSGPGIPVPVAEKMFSPFFTTKEVGKGTGLGLSITTNVIKGHKGQIEVDHSFDHTAILIKLPLSQPEQQDHHSLESMQTSAK